MSADDELFGDDPPMLTGMGPGPDGTWQVTTTGAHEVVLAMADSMAKMLDDAGATNYIEVDVKAAGEVDGYTLSIRRAGGKAPHALRREAEARLERVLDTLGRYDESCSDDLCECCPTWRSLVSEAIREADAAPSGIPESGES